MEPILVEALCAMEDTAMVHCPICIDFVKLDETRVDEDDRFYDPVCRECKLVIATLRLGASSDEVLD